MKMSLKIKQYFHIAVFTFSFCCPLQNFFLYTLFYFKNKHFVSPLDLGLIFFGINMKFLVNINDGGSQNVIF